jgi:hypothetical protein
MLKKEGHRTAALEKRNMKRSEKNQKVTEQSYQLNIICMAVTKKMFSLNELSLIIS